MRLLVAGDTHGFFPEANRLTKHAQANAIDKIWVCGDFGVWTHAKWGWYFINQLSKNAGARNIVVYFTPGNHENYDQLEEWERTKERDDDGMVVIRDNVRFAPKSGHFWSWDGKQFASVGGAVSVDRQGRIPGLSWWPQEQLTDAEVDALPNTKVDVLFTHDCPTVAPFRVRLKNDPESHIHRQRMDRVAKKLRPEVWMHGHMHERYDEYPFYFPPDQGYARCYGLAESRMVDCWGILDTDSMSFLFEKELEYV